MESQHNRCEIHDAGGPGLPCPWPECGVKDNDRITFGSVTYKRVTNKSDDKDWYSWQLIRTR